MYEHISIIMEEALVNVNQASGKITPGQLLGWLRNRFSMNTLQAKSIIQQLIRREELTYTYQHGCTFLERSFNKPTRISSNIILTPGNRQYIAQKGEVVVKIAGGAAFGVGDHPTTRLSLKGLEYVLTDPDADLDPESTCLDIGTGSGVLVIASIKLGINAGLGIDTDPNAISEAKHNVALNGLDSRIAIEDIPVVSLTGPFSLIVANLRYPTLIKLLPGIRRLLEHNGFLVMSGFRMHELPYITDAYTQSGFTSVRTNEEKQWGCITYKKDG